MRSPLRELLVSVLATGGALLEPPARAARGLLERGRASVELVLVASGVLLLGVALGWFVAWLGGGH